MTIKAAAVIPALHATKTTVQEASVMDRSGDANACEEVVRLMSTDLFAFTLLWCVNNGCHFFLVIFTFAVSSFICLSLGHLVSVHV